MCVASLGKRVFWLGIAALGALAVGGIAGARGEAINAWWLIAAAVCVYAIGYRVYGAWVATRVLLVDGRPTPAVRIDDGRDFVPTNRWVVFGHHFAAIAGPGPLV
ncbi:MAG: carbon starvation CstA family protein, partial [Porticoccaceae bacterium]